MKSIHSATIILLILIASGCKAPPKPTTYVVDYKYFVTLPKDYEQQESCPLILYLHGRSLGSSNIEFHKEYGIGKYAEEIQDFPFIIVAPQTSNEWRPDPLNNILKEVIKEYRVDEDRIYCSGYSLGGYGTFLMAFDYPSKFAAIAVVSGWGVPELACKIKDLPVWMFHDKGDPVVPYYMAQNMEQALENCGGDVRVTTYDSNSHGITNEAYFETELYEWFLSHTTGSGL